MPKIATREKKKKKSRIHSEIGIEEKEEMEIGQGEDLHKILAKSKSK
jgi:hypothetical protein